jgi:hypothetical protein
MTPPFPLDVQMKVLLVKTQKHKPSVIHQSIRHGILYENSLI